MIQLKCCLELKRLQKVLTQTVNNDPLSGYRQASLEPPKYWPLPPEAQSASDRLPMGSEIDVSLTLCSGNQRLRDNYQRLEFQAVLHMIREV